MAYSQSSSQTDRITFRTQVLSGHLIKNSTNNKPLSLQLHPSKCLSYSPPELKEHINFDTNAMRRLMDGKYVEDMDWLFKMISHSELFCQREKGGKLYLSPDYNCTMEAQREVTMKRIAYCKEVGLFDGWFLKEGDGELRNLALTEVISGYDHSLFVKMGVHFYLW